MGAAKLSSDGYDAQQNDDPITDEAVHYFPSLIIAIPLLARKA
jgi:hypothetical protein